MTDDQQDKRYKYLIFADNPNIGSLPEVCVITNDTDEAVIFQKTTFDWILWSEVISDLTTLFDKSSCVWLRYLFFFGTPDIADAEVVYLIFLHLVDRPFIDYAGCVAGGGADAVSDVIGLRKK